MARTRTRQYSNGSGFARYQGASTSRSDTSESKGWSQVVDEFGVRDGAFIVTHVYASGSITGRVPSQQVPYREAQSWVPSYFRNPTSTAVTHLSVPGLPSLTESATKLVVATNPSKPLVDIPVAIAELGDLPSLVRKFGQGILRRIADGNLRYEFGVKPMVGDFIKLLEFKKSMDHQLKLLSQLREGAIIRKAHIFTGSAEAFDGSIITVHSSPSELVTSVTKMYTRTTVSRWGYVKWTPNIPEFNAQVRSDTDARLLAKRILLGLTLDASTAWEALPWSWLADWFGNIGDHLASKRSLIPVTAGLPSICTTTRTTIDFTIRPSSWCASLGSGFTLTKVTKVRDKSAASTYPSADLPLLTGRQVGILTSLAVLRRR